MRNRLWLVGLGIFLGLALKFCFGGYLKEKSLDDDFGKPEKSTIEKNEKSAKQPRNRLQADATDPLVPPMVVPGMVADKRPSPLPTRLASFTSLTEDFTHDTAALFEPHGDKVCASGCALSRHPTKELTEAGFHRLLQQFANEPMSQDSTAFEELLFFGRQTRQLIQKHGAAPLDPLHRSVLQSQLTRTHVSVSIRVIDEQGKIRCWIEPTRVPLDRRHVFAMQVNDVQPLVTSGTVKRVGLNHLWVRL